METTRQQGVAGAGVLFCLLLTGGTLFDLGTSFHLSNTVMRIQPRPGDLTIIPASRATTPLIADLNAPASADPFTGKPKQITNRLPAPPPPPLDLPVPPPLPLQTPEK